MLPRTIIRIVYIPMCKCKNILNRIFMRTSFVLKYATIYIYPHPVRTTTYLLIWAEMITRLHTKYTYKDIYFHRMDTTKYLRARNICHFYFQLPVRHKSIKQFLWGNYQFLLVNLGAGFHFFVLFIKYLFLDNIVTQ